MCENFPSTKPVSFCCSPAGGNGDGFSSFVWADPKYNRCLVCIIVRHFVLVCAVCFMVLVRRKLAMFSDAFAV